MTLSLSLGAGPGGRGWEVVGGALRVEAGGEVKGADGVYGGEGGDFGVFLGGGCGLRGQGAGTGFCAWALLGAGGGAG